MRQQRVADLAQLAEHVTSNDEVGGSNPLVSIMAEHVTSNDEVGGSNPLVSIRKIHFY